MELGRFRRTLDRFGSTFSNWPLRDAGDGRRLISQSDEARAAHALAQRIEAGLRASRPTVGRDQVRLVVARAAAEVARREMRPTFGRTMRIALADPWTRTVFAVSLTAIGFAIGTAIGAPDLARARDASDGPFITATTDDPSF